MDEKWVMIKPYTTEQGTIPEGSEFFYFRGAYYMNGGMLTPDWNKLIQSLMDNPEYTKKVRIQKNEF